MAEKIIRDADNKWQTYIDWTDWIASKAVTTSEGPGLTVAIVSTNWDIDPALTEEQTTTIGNKTHIVCSGGTNGEEYDLICTITYSASELSLSDLTQDQTMTVKLKEL